jgi:hypothetical protein
MTDDRGSHSPAVSLPRLRLVSAFRRKTNGALHIFGLTLILSLLSSRAFTQTSPAATIPAPAAAPSMFAFAKASPIQVADSASLTDTHPQDFEFGKAYEATEESSAYVKLKLRDDRFVYVRSTYVTTTRSPQWLTSTPSYNRPERARVEFWENSVKLIDFISGTNTAGSRSDYEEYFDGAPNFQLKLPVVERDSVDLLNGKRQVRILSVMMPISRQMYQAFELAKSSSERPLDLNFLIDVSGSTNGFLEKVSAGIVKAINRNAQFRKRVRSTTVTTFGASRASKSSFLGAIAVEKVGTMVWHPPGVDQTTEGEREPLADALVTMNANLRPDDAAAQVLVILSGADVELATTAAGKPLTIANLELSLRTQPAAVVAQITPEPGNDLKNVTQQLRNLSRRRYIDYSDTMADDIVLELIRIAENQKAASMDAKAFGSVLAAGNEKRMMTFLPRSLTPASSLPARQAYAAQSGWYTIRLWLPVDELIWKESVQ